MPRWQDAPRSRLRPALALSSSGTVGVAAYQFFSQNRRVRVARREPLVGYYRTLAFG